MEKIQDAIAKARATRKRTTDRSAPITDAINPAPIADAINPALIADAITPATLAVHIPPSPAQVADLWAALPAFAPKAAHLQRNRIVAFTSGREATAFDVIRTRLLQQMRANNWRRLAITDRDRLLQPSFLKARISQPDNILRPAIDLTVNSRSQRVVLRQSIH